MSIGIITHAGGGMFRKSSASLAAAYRSAVMADSPTAYWRLGETSGTTAFDETGNYNATYQGAPTLGISGPIEAAQTGMRVEYQKYATAPTPGTLANFTIELWAYRRGDLGTESALFSDVYVNNVNFTIRAASAVDVNGGFFNGSWHYSPAFYLELDNWVHIVFTYDGTTMRFYRNGILVGSQVDGGSAFSSNTGLRIGRRWDNESYPPVDLAEVALYPTALSTAAIKNHYDTAIGATGGALNLLDYSPTLFYDDDHTTLYDAVTGGSQVALGGKVLRWEDKSGFAKHAIQPGGSLYAPNRAADGSEVVWDGNTMELYTENSGISSRGDLTYLAVHRLELSGNWQTIIGTSNDPNATAAGELYIQRRGNTTQLGCHNSGVADVGVFVDTGSLANLEIMRVTMLTRSGGDALGNGGVIKVRSNDLVATGAQNWNTSLDTQTIRLGSRQQNLVGWFKGGLILAAAWNRALTDEEASVIMDHYVSTYVP